MLTAAPEKNVEKKLAELVCEACGVKFRCGAEIGEYWCFDLNLGLNDLANLREKFNQCLCESCLSKVKSDRFPGQN